MTAMSGKISDQLRDYIRRTGDNTTWQGPDGETDRGGRHDKPLYSERTTRGGSMRGTYYRWTRQHNPSGNQDSLRADILGAETDIVAYPERGMVQARIPSGDLDADTARMIGVRLIEAAALADAGRSVREP